MDLTHEVELNSSTNYLTYEAATDTVVQGHADAAVWDVQGSLNVVGIGSGTYGKFLYPALAPAGEPHLTSYYNWGPGDRIRMRGHKLYGTTGSGVSAMHWMSFECAEDGTFAVEQELVRP
jgi:hypothetical protein